ncbi:unnamed protein product [Wuchereria bancrofti]|uniref:Uncharacterized protein n=1 Tax=Wuchereria bancrofti TaxID=6293 RepID=A0A3P7F2U0_WUCBA|nr:unnamed protein product [Wuchereria bancrofti]
MMFIKSYSADTLKMHTSKIFKVFGKFPKSVDANDLFLSYALQCGCCDDVVGSTTDITDLENGCILQQCTAKSLISTNLTIST